MWHWETLILKSSFKYGITQKTKGTINIRGKYPMFRSSHSLDNYTVFVGEQESRIRRNIDSELPCARLISLNAIDSIQAINNTLSNLNIFKDPEWYLVDVQLQYNTALPIESLQIIDAHLMSFDVIWCHLMFTRSLWNPQYVLNMFSWLRAHETKCVIAHPSRVYLIHICSIIHESRTTQWGV